MELASRPRSLPMRSGPRPRTEAGPPHTQLDQLPPRSVCGLLRACCLGLPAVRCRESRSARQGTCALWLASELARGPREAFLFDGEFAHLHPLPGSSLHLTLPGEQRAWAERNGWVEPHPMTRAGILPPTVVLAYAPRDVEELSAVFGLVEVSYGFARGTLAGF